MKATRPLATMAKHILNAGIKTQYVLMGSWFTMQANIIALRKHINVIGMIKKSKKILYDHEGLSRDLKTINQNLSKHRRRAKILTSTTVTRKDGKPAKIVFTQARRKKDWLTVFLKNIKLADEYVVRIHGKCRDIEMLFKMPKQHLNLAKEIHCQDFGALIAHTTIVFMCFFHFIQH